MYYFVNGRSTAVLWLAVFVFCVNCVSTQSLPLHDRTHNKVHNNHRRNAHNQVYPLERYEGQHFPRENNPAQRILDTIKTNIETNPNFQFASQSNFNFNLENLRKQFDNKFGNVAEQVAQNTYNILNKTFGNLNQFSVENFSNLLQLHTVRPILPVPVPLVPIAVPVAPMSVPVAPTSAPAVPTTVPLAQTSVSIASTSVSTTPSYPLRGRTNKGEQENYKTTTPSPSDDNIISHYIDGNFPVILLKPSEIRR